MILCKRWASPLTKFSLGYLLFLSSTQANYSYITPENIEKAKQGDSFYQRQLADEYCKKGEYQESLYWLEHKAEQTEAPSDQEKVAEAYYKGTCQPYSLNSIQQFPKDYRKALEWYYRVTSNPKVKDTHYYYSARFRIADIYNFGEGGIEKNGVAARRIYEEIANIPDAFLKPVKDSEEIDKLVITEFRGNARHRLAQMYYFGNFVRQDDKKVFEWGLKAWQDGSQYGGTVAAVVQYQTREHFQNKKAATELMGDICDKSGHSQACEWYQDMRANRPLRKGSL
ncbi:MAG: hypothetical protein Q4A60_01430 [Pasteurellaceae bacterium]|nr:hypothetical protein [Pasteurellaceae bacterium]